jgi:hypothetical protein
MRLWRLIVIVVPGALIAACSVLRPDLGDTPAPPVVSSAETAQLVVYRPRQRALRKVDIYPEVLIDGTSLGALSYNGFLVYPTAPTDAELVVTGRGAKANGWDFPDRKLPIQLVAGQTLYVRLSLRYNGNATLTKPGDYSVQLRTMREHTALVEMEGARQIRPR